MNPFADKEARFTQAVREISSRIDELRSKKNSEEEYVPISELTLLHEKIEDQKATNQELREENQDLQEQIEAYKSQISRQKEAKKELQRKLECQADMIDDVDAVIDGLRQEVERRNGSTAD